jgi:hypothetical protein
VNYGLLKVVTNTHPPSKQLERNNSTESNATTITNTTTTSECMLIDGEFINSEFYIDESLPSSLNTSDERQEDVEKFQCGSNNNDNLSSFNEIDDPQSVIMLLQVYIT